MASCQTSRWVANSAPYVKLTVTQSSSTETTATLSWKLQYISDYPAEAGSRNYTVKIADSTVKTGTYNINGVTGTKTIASGTKTINKTHSAQTISFSVSFDFKITWSGVYAGTKTASGSISVAKKTSYTVSYNANGGSGAPSSQTKWYGETLTLSSTKPTRTGRNFAGWGTSASGSAVYSAGGSYTANSSATLYAIWNPHTHTIAYNANGGSNAPGSQTKTYGSITYITTSTPSRTGYNFKHWNTESNGTGTAYNPGQAYGYDQNGGTVTLYAIWTPHTHTIAYNANGGTNAPSSQSKYYGSLTYITSSKPTRSGYNFKCWNTQANGTGTSYNPGQAYGYDQNGGTVTLYAIWTPMQYTVSYNANGGSGAPGNQTKTYGTDLVLSSTKPTRKYYTFKGWATSASGSVVYSSGGAYKTNANATLYAVWEVAYIIPRITGVSITRCDADGNQQDDGTCGLVKFNWATDEDVTAIKIYWKASTDATYVNNIGVAATGRSGSVSEVVGGGALSEDHAYSFKIEVLDNTDRNSATQTLTATLFPFDMLAGGKGVTIGGPAKEEGFRVEMDSYFKGRKYGENKLLWSGSEQMGDGVEITLNESISAQPHGIVLAWSYYTVSTSTVQNHDWHYTFVPKYHIVAHSGGGVTCPLTVEGTVRRKYLYIKDKSITGNANNTNASYGTGVDNRAFVLREVIGV